MLSDIQRSFFPRALLFSSLTFACPLWSFFLRPLHHSSVNFQHSFVPIVVFFGTPLFLLLCFFLFYSPSVLFNLLVDHCWNSHMGSALTALLGK